MGERRVVFKVLVQRSEGKTRQLGRPKGGWRVLKQVFRNWDEEVRTEPISLRTGSSGGGLL